MMEHPLSFATLAVHAGERPPKPDFTPVNTPIYQSASFVYDSIETMDAIFGGERQGYVYSRYGNPTVSALEQAVAALEGGETAVAFASGMAAIHATLLALDVGAGTTVVAAQDLYGATSTLLTTIFTRLGVNVRLIDMTDLDEVAATLELLKPKVVLAETISNPLLKVVDLPRVAELAHAHGATMVADSTFTSPYLLQPLQHGADLNRLRLCLLATTLGDIYTELLYPTMSSHRMLTPEQRARVGISDALIRLSAGIEEAADVIADLDHALGNVS